MDTSALSGLLLNPWVVATGISLATLLILLLLKRIVLGRAIVAFKTAGAQLGLNSDYMNDYAGPIEYFLLILMGTVGISITPVICLAGHYLAGGCPGSAADSGELLFRCSAAYGQTDPSGGVQSWQ